MKRFLFSAALLVFLLPGGCMKQAKENYEKDLQKVSSLLEGVAAIFIEYDISLSAKIDDESLEELFYINPEDTVCYAGVYSRAVNSSDNLLVVHAKKDKIDAVVSGLQQRQKDVMMNFENYLPEQYEKAKNGQVVQKGNFAVLIMLGDTQEDLEQMGKDAANHFLSAVG